jgi:uncharacterized protein (DUF1778 family)
MMDISEITKVLDISEINKVLDTAAEATGQYGGYSRLEFLLAAVLSNAGVVVRKRDKPGPFGVDSAYVAQ